LFLTKQKGIEMTKIVLQLLILLSLILGGSIVAEAQNRVNGYWRSNGTYVQPHYRSAPDNSRYNNYGCVYNGSC
jgi:hypothetical protein